jgi:hypothetical protein
MPEHTEPGHAITIATTCTHWNTARQRQAVRRQTATTNDHAVSVECPPGLRCVVRSVDGWSRPTVVSDRLSEFGEACGGPQRRWGVAPEFVVSAA